MTHFAIIQTGGKQYKISAGDKIKVEKLNAQEGENFIFDKILLVADGAQVQIGAPYVENAKAEAKILRQAKDKTKIVFKYKSKTRRRKKKGHRQRFTEIQIDKIETQ